MCVSGCVRAFRCVRALDFVGFTDMSAEARVRVLSDVHACKMKVCLGVHARVFENVRAWVYMSEYVTVFVRLRVCLPVLSVYSI